MSQFQLRPLGVGEILDATLSLYRRRFVPMVLVALICQGVPYVFLVLGGCTTTLTGGTTCSTPFLGFLGQIGSAVGYPLAVGASILLAAGVYAGLEPNWQAALRSSLRQWFGLVISGIALGVLVAISSLFLLVPGIFVFVSLCLAWEAIMLENVGAMASLRRSWRLASGSRWRILGAGVVTLLATGIVGGLAGAAVANVFDQGLAQLLANVFLVIPAFSALGVVIYLELRVRQDDLTEDELRMRLAS